MKQCKKLHKACDDFYGLDGSIACDFVGDEEFLKIFSARIIQVVMDVSQDKDEFPPSFYRYACGILFLLCCENTERADAFVANDGAVFLLDYLESFTSNLPVLISCFEFHRVILRSLNANESAAFAGMILGKLVDVFELNHETTDVLFYQCYCLALCSTFRDLSFATLWEKKSRMRRLILRKCSLAQRASVPTAALELYLLNCWL